MTDLKQCPYDKATKCKMDEPCEGCETWAEATSEEGTVDPWKIVSNLIKDVKVLHQERDSYKKKLEELTDENLAAVNKAIGHFKEDDPGWEDGMDTLQDMQVKLSKEKQALKGK